MVTCVTKIKTKLNIGFLSIEFLTQLRPLLFLFHFLFLLIIQLLLNKQQRNFQYQQQQNLSQYIFRHLQHLLVDHVVHFLFTEVPVNYQNSTATYPHSHQTPKSNFHRESLDRLYNQISVVDYHGEYTLSFDASLSVFDILQCQLYDGPHDNHYETAM